MQIKAQSWRHLAFFAFFGLSAIFIFWYYLSFTVIHPTSDRQFPINSISTYPLSIPILIAETFSFLFALYFLYCLISDMRRPAPPKPLAEKVPVAICLPVYNEPTDVVDRTLYAVRKIRWPKTVIYLLDDSKRPECIADMQALAKKHGAILVRRPDNKGYKAGNVNHAVMTVIKEEYFVILDADQAPEPEFLERTMDQFSDPDVFFVQTPQYYINDDTPIRRAAKVGTNIFYQSMCVAKAKDGALPFCGTNLIVRRSMFLELKGFSYYTSTEDIELGLRADAKGWRGAYVPEVLVRGYAPPDWRAYASQQYRWANGNLAILRSNAKQIFWGDYSIMHNIHSFFTVGWWFIGITTLLYILVPMLSLLLQSPTHHLWLPSAIIPLLYLNFMCGVLMIYVALRDRVDGDQMSLFDAFLQYSLIVNSIFIYAKAATNAMLKRYIGFVTTDKAGTNPGIADIKWNLALGIICLAGSLTAGYHVAAAQNVQQVRTYLPIMIWLLFYGLVLFSAILFVNDAPAKNAAPKPAQSTPPTARPASAQSSSAKPATPARMDNAPPAHRAPTPAPAPHGKPKKGVRV
jgi:cellulose synthase/poly-beta-1,6-N-acetylglucosamine synthase-like glycosyltransferase